MLQSYRNILYFEGILFIILGLIAIALPQFFTIGIELFIGILFVAAGIVQVIRLFQGKDNPGFWATVLSALLNLVIGGLLLTYPIAGVFSLTFLLIAYFLVEGIAKTYFAFQLKPEKNWGWVLLSGLVSFLLALLIFTGLPGSALWVLGLLVGINMLFFGISLFSLAGAIERK